MFLFSVFEDLNEKQRFPCESCGRIYKQKRGLWQHLRFECGKLPEFECTLCSYKAKRKTSLQSHMIYKHMKNIFDTI